MGFPMKQNMIIFVLVSLSQWSQGQVKISSDDLKVASKVVDIGPFPDVLVEQASLGVENQIQFYQQVRSSGLLKDGGVGDVLPTVFDPSLGQRQCTPTFSDNPWEIEISENTTFPDNFETIFLLPLNEIAGLLRSGEISSLELTLIAIDRVKKLDKYLEMLITLTEQLALEQASQADEELQMGIDRGILHGIPYGLKDIISVSGYRTTWGAKPFENQIINQDAYVYQKLREAGAVLIGKLSAGAMARGDIWFGGQTKNPWDLLKGSSGSSAGSAAAVSSVTLPFAIGSETSGSLANPSDRVGVTSIRPTFGAVGRTGVMSLSPSLDKLGPMCRHAIDCAIVLNAITGKDQQDTSSVAVNFENPSQISLKDLRVGIQLGASQNVINLLKQQGVTIIKVQDLKGQLGDPQLLRAALVTILDSEVAANFDEWLRTNKALKMIDRSQWPESILQSRFIPAVEYINAQRVRSKIIQDASKFFEENQLDGVLGNWIYFNDVGNLAGLPLVVFPVGFYPVDTGSPRKQVLSQALMGPLWSDMKLASLVDAFQYETDFHLQVPPIQNVEPFVLETCTYFSTCALPKSTVEANKGK